MVWARAAIRSIVGILVSVFAVIYTPTLLWLLARTYHKCLQWKSARAQHTPLFMHTLEQSTEDEDDGEGFMLSWPGLGGADAPPWGMIHVCPSRATIRAAPAVCFTQRTKKRGQKMTTIMISCGTGTGT